MFDKCIFFENVITMELIPILYTVLLISLGLLVVVLVYSVNSSRKEKKVVGENYKELVNQRKMAYSREQSEYIKRMNGAFEPVDSESESQEDLDNPTASNSSDDKSERQEKAGIEESYFIPGKTRGHGRRRFAVLNNSVSVQKEIPSSQQTKSVYPVNVNSSGNYYG